MTQGTQTEALQQPRGEGGGWEVQEFQEGEDIKKKKKKRNDLLISLHLA